ncbi:lysozyme [Asaia sp. VD9]|uniref:lysozyme n=1 Tax=Asaia sp. VD9 TaxID=3081235 RepID=UPI003017D06F
MTPSLEIALALLRRDDIEGLRLAPYLCPAGYWTIGIGNRFLGDGSPVTAVTKPVTETEALDLTGKTLAGLRKTLLEAVHVPLAPWQEGALLSWQFNVGSAAMRSSTLVSLLNRGLYAAAGQQLLRWDKATVNGRLIVLPGLQRRRRIELSVYQGRPAAGVPFTV